MIITADINRFVPGSCFIFIRDSSHTIDRIEFVEWASNFLILILGRFEYSEPISVIVIDNITTHICNEVEYIIQKADAVLFYTAPNSLDLNPI